jgi:hypothetical protein
MEVEDSLQCSHNFPLFAVLSHKFEIVASHSLSLRYILILSRLGVTTKTGFGLDDWIYCTLYIRNSGLQAVTALSLFYTFSSSPLYTH